MKLTCRAGCWETNSSSVHAIAISKKKIDIDELHSEYAFLSTLNFHHGEFGWEHKLYNYVGDKASYLYQAIWEVYSPSYTSKANESPEREKALNWLYDTLGKYGINAEFDKKHYDEYNWCIGYIDHGTQLQEFVSKIIGNEKRLLAYLFGESEICTSNDNDDMDDITEFIKSHPKKDFEIYEKWN